MCITLFPTVSLTFLKVVLSPPQKSCLFLRCIVQGKGINRCAVPVEMLSLFNGMHRADIMSVIVSGRKPFLSAPDIPILEMEQQMDNCPCSSDSSGCLTDLFALYCTSLRCSFRVKIYEKRHLLRKGLVLQTSLLEELIN